MGGPGTVDGEDREEFANFLPCRIEKDGIVYRSAEHFFQAHKTLDLPQRQRIASASFDSVYACGRMVDLRPDWEGVKLRVMLEAAELKYEQNPELGRALVTTEGEMTFTPSAGFWGVNERTGTGENWNGRIHAAVRAKLRGDDAEYRRLVEELDSRCAELAAAATEGAAAPGAK